MKPIHHHIALLQSKLEEAVARADDPTGPLLYYYTLSQVNPREQALTRATELLVQLVARIMAEQQSSIRGMFLIREFEEAGVVTAPVAHQLPLLDQHLHGKAQRLLRQESFREMYQATEISYYLSQRQSDPVARQYLGHLLAMMFPEDKPDVIRQFAGVNLPVDMEGWSGCLLMLVYVAFSTRNDQLKARIKEGIRYLISLRNEVDFSEKIYSYFPSMTRPVSQRDVKDRLAWNDSDLAPTVLLYQASVLYQDSALARMAELTGLNTLLRMDRVYHSVNNASFYRGAAGIAHTYRTFYRVSAHEAYRGGYDFWTQRAIALLEKDFKKQRYDQREGELLQGMVGIALTLLSRVADQELLWDKAVLLRR